MNQARIKVAAVQLATRIADVDANLASCERLALQAVRDGARWIALPEFFNTGVSWNPKLVDTIEPIDGRSAQFLRDFSARHQVLVGGSLLCRLPSGAVRNRYLCFDNGSFVGQHDKDLPTMWENYFYEGGDPADTGLLGRREGIRIGTAVCWEFMRTMTARRLRQQVDVIIGGSCWWSLPTRYLPTGLRNRWETVNSDNAIGCVRDTARLLGVPVLHAAHSGAIECPMPGLPLRYHGYFQGHAAIVDARGEVLAHRAASDGAGVVSAEIVPRACETSEPIPDRYWMRPRGWMAAAAWHYQKWLGRPWYARHVHRR